MKRFLVAGNLALGARIELSPEEAKHCTRVMRLGVGDSLILTNGRGVEAEAKILSAEKAGVVVEITNICEQAPSPFRCELIQAPLKGPRMDWLVEKATELGVSALHVMDSQYSVAGGERSDRWKRLAQAAMKQSGNPQFPEIFDAAPLGEILGRMRGPFSGFLLSPSAQIGLADGVALALKNGATNLVLAIGPEGGFSREEDEVFQARGFLPCRISRQILRGETAAISALSIALHTLEIGTSLRL